MALKGWQATSALTLENIVAHDRTFGVQHVLCPDLSRDGPLAGSNVPVYRAVCAKVPDVHCQPACGTG